jgi:HlyD family secretion protein
MDSKIFRKVSLERLSSPEQLDQILRVTNPKNWVALLAILILLGVTVAWGYGGSVASKAVGQGVIVRSGGVLNVVSAGSGMVVSLTVNVGDHVQPDQVVAKVAQPEIVERIRDTEDQMAEARSQQELSQKLHTQDTKLQQGALAHQRENAERQIAVLKKQIDLVNEQLPIDEELLRKGLVTKQQTLANKQKLVQLNSQIEGLEAQITQYDAQKFEIDVQPVQNQVEMQSRIADLSRTLAGLNERLKMAANVTAPYGGEVLELKVYPGATVPAGAPLLSIQPDVKSLQALIYLPADKAKSVIPGMEVQISPSTVKREEFGYIRGKVVFVSDYPSTSAALMRNFQNESLVQSLTGNGPVTEIRAELIADSKTSSGFAWSSSAGPEITITGGTICSAQVVTREQKPITLVFPYIKSKLGLS